MTLTANEPGTAGTSSSPPPGTVRTYADDVVRRARVPMPPHGYVVDWQDQPRREKTYTGVPAFTMPVGEPVRDDLTAALARPAWEGAGDHLSVPRLGRALHDTYGLLARRLRVTGNDDAVGKPRTSTATYSRGTANGGGLYPLELHWVSGPSGVQVPGVHHWSPADGTLRRLLAGDVTDRLRAALGDGVPDTDQFLLVTVKLWKNSFKYNSFTHHVVTMDLGATLATLGLVGLTGDGAAPVPHLWFDSAAVDGVLGLDPLDETTFAVVPLPPGPLPRVTPSAPTDAVVRARDEERSRTTRRFDQVSDVIRATLGQGAGAPDVSDVRHPRAGSAEDADERGTAPISLPSPPPPTATDGVSAVLGRRRSSFGTFTGRAPLTAAELSALLHGTTRGSRLRTDAGTAAFARLGVLVNHVEGVPAGTYLFDEEGSTLAPVDDDPPGAFLQAAYFLDNYNVEQAAAVITVTVPTDAALDALGDRGIRLVNAVVGAATQHCYVTAAAHGLACGAALGFDNVGYAERLGLDGTGEWPMIMLMVGRDRADQADVSYTLSPIPEETM